MGLKIDGIRQHISARTKQMLYFRFREDGIPLAAGSGETIAATVTIYSTSGVALLTSQALSAVSDGWYSIEVNASTWTLGSGYRASITVAITETT